MNGHHEFAPEGQNKTGSFITTILPNTGCENLSQKIITMSQVAYSTVLASPDCFLTPKIQIIIIGGCIKQEKTKLLKELTKNDMQHCIEQ